MSIDIVLLFCFVMAVTGAYMVGFYGMKSIAWKSLQKACDETRQCSYSHFIDHVIIHLSNVRWYDGLTTIVRGKTP